MTRLGPAALAPRQSSGSRNPAGCWAWSSPPAVLPGGSSARGKGTWGAVPWRIAAPLWEAQRSLRVEGRKLETPTDTGGEENVNFRSGGKRRKGIAFLCINIR